MPADLEPLRLLVVGNSCLSCKVSAVALHLRHAPLI
jgi:hypothetical protein